MPSAMTATNPLMSNCLADGENQLISPAELPQTSFQQFTLESTRNEWFTYVLLNLLKERWKGKFLLRIAA